MFSCDSELKMMRESTIVMRGGAETGGESRRVSGGAYECSKTHHKSRKITLRLRSRPQASEQSAPVRTDTYSSLLAYRSKKIEAPCPSRNSVIPKLLKKAREDLSASRNRYLVPRSSERSRSGTGRMGIEVLPSLSMGRARY